MIGNTSQIGAAFGAAGWYRADEIVGHHFSVFYPPEDVAAGKPMRALQEARQRGRHEEEGWRVRKDGSRFWASVVISAMRTPSGNVEGFSKVTRDLTERKALAKQELAVLKTVLA